MGCDGDPPSANFPKLRGREEDLDAAGSWYPQRFLSSGLNVSPEGSRVHRMGLTASHSGPLSYLGVYGIQ